MHRTDHLVDRRRLGLGAMALLSGCAAPRRDAGPVLVNLADPGPPPTGDLGADLDTGADFSGRVTAPVRINGAGPFNFVVDTGANRTVVSNELAQALGLPSQGQADVHGIAGVEPSATVLVEQLQVGDVTARGLRSPTLPRSRLGVDGLLGVDVMRDRRVRLDFLRREMKIEPSGPVADSRASTLDMLRRATGPLAGGGTNDVVVPATFRFGQLIIIAADVAGKPVTAFLDSGSQSTVGNRALRRQVLGTAPDPRGRRYVAPLYSATGQTAQGEVAGLPPLRLGGLTMTGVVAAFADLHVFDLWRLQDRSTLLIGVDVMKSFEAITLDFGRRKVIFTLPRRRGAGPAVR